MALPYGVDCTMLYWYNLMTILVTPWPMFDVTQVTSRLIRIGIKGVFAEEWKILFTVLRN